MVELTDADRFGLFVLAVSVGPIAAWFALGWLAHGILIAARRLARR